jgi:PAS domain S-box-containing protein
VIQLKKEETIMLTWIRQFFAAPVFEGDEDKTRVAGLLNTILLAYSAMIVMMGIVVLSTIPNRGLGLVIMGILILVDLGVLFLMRSGRVQLANGLLSLALGVFFILLTFGFGGVLSPGFSSYIVVILIAGLLLGGRAGIVFAGLGAVAGLGAFYAELHGFLPPSSMPITPALGWTAVTACFIMAAVLLHLATRSITDALERARHNAQALAESNCQLQREIIERVRAEEKIVHLNLVLRAIRNVNQLITRERDRDRLLQGACETLIETRGYHSAWIALLDESEGLVTTAEAGLGKDFLPLVEQLKRGELTDCGRRALKHSGAVVTADPSIACADCPLSSMYDGRGAVTVRLGYGGKIYGLLSASIPGDLAADEEERALFEEVTGDIAFALHNIELEEKRKRAEEALQESEEKLRSIVENTPDIVMRVDRDGTIQFINYVLPGFEKEDIVGKKRIYDFVPPEYHQRVRETLDHVFKTGNPGSYDIAGAGASGNIAYYSTSVGPFKSGEKVISAVLISKDVTERKAAEEALKEYSERLEEMVEERTQELRDAQEQLVRQEKLAVLGQLAGGVGHELRNPLGAIKSATYFLNMVLEEPEPEVKETLEILEKEVATSENVISSLLDFARSKPPTRRKMDINKVVQEALSRIAVSESVEVVSQLDGALPAILADPDQLGQVFGNIILNAIQAMPEGGRLVVKSQVPGPEWVAVSFTDTGVGIPEENLGKLFEPLFTTKAKGIGLGMAVTKALVEGHGGSIEVQSEMGKGSTFTVKLPTGGKEKM